MTIFLSPGTVEQNLLHRKSDNVGISVISSLIAQNHGSGMVGQEHEVMRPYGHL